MSSLLVSILSRLTRWPTSFHLWCAERELRMGKAPTAELQRTRERNLHLLRSYRLRRDFPKNLHDKLHLAPCFVDTDGRACAVAFLMTESGAYVGVEKITAKANFARIAQMQFAELEAWTSESGLTQAELARIQPGYPPTPEQAAKYAEVIVSLGIVGVLALVSVIFNMVRLLWGFRPHLTTVSAGIVIGLILYCLGLCVDTGEFIYIPSLYGDVANAQLLAIGLGILAIFCGIIPFWLRLGKWKPTVGDSDTAVSRTCQPKPANEHVKDLKYGPFKPAD
jgi:hypothetical protein